MNITIKGGNSFSYLEVELSPGEVIRSESGAMTSMSSQIDLRTQFNGGFFRAILLKLFGKESLFVNKFKNTSQENQKIFLSQNSPGEIVSRKVSGESFYIQPGSFIASTQGVKFSLSWAGIHSFLGGEGFFRLKVSGIGQIYYGAFGSVIEKEIIGEYIVDSGHLLSYPKNIKLKAQLSGGIFSSFFGGEGFVLKLSGKGKIQLQTRSLSGLAGWLNPRF